MSQVFPNRIFLTTPPLEYLDTNCHPYEEQNSMVRHLDILYLITNPPNPCKRVKSERCFCLITCIHWRRSLKKFVIWRKMHVVKYYKKGNPLSGQYVEPPIGVKKSNKCVKYLNKTIKNIFWKLIKNSKPQFALIGRKVNSQQKEIIYNY